MRTHLAYKTHLHCHTHTLKDRRKSGVHCMVEDVMKMPRGCHCLLCLISQCPDICYKDQNKVLKLKLFQL